MACSGTARQALRTRGVMSAETATLSLAPSTNGKPSHDPAQLGERGLGLRAGRPLGHRRELDAARVEQQPGLRVVAGPVEHGPVRPERRRLDDAGQDRDRGPLRRRSRSAPRPRRGRVGRHPLVAPDVEPLPARRGRERHPEARRRRPRRSRARPCPGRTPARRRSGRVGEPDGTDQQAAAAVVAGERLPAARGRPSAARQPAGLDGAVELAGRRSAGLSAARSAAPTRALARSARAARRRCGRRRASPRRRPSRAGPSSPSTFTLAALPGRLAATLPACLRPALSLSGRTTTRLPASTWAKRGCHLPEPSGRWSR